MQSRKTSPGRRGTHSKNTDNNFKNVVDSLQDNAGTALARYPDIDSMNCENLLLAIQQLEQSPLWSKVDESVMEEYNNKLEYARMKYNSSCNVVTPLGPPQIAPGVGTAGGAGATDPLNTGSGGGIGGGGGGGAQTGVPTAGKKKWWVLPLIIVAGVGAAYYLSKGEKA